MKTVKTQVTISYTLPDGVVIKTGNGKRNKTGYIGAAFSPAWSQDGKRPFLAACSNPRDTAIHLELGTERSQNARTAWHGGSYADAREAAYVVGLFKQDPVATDRAVHARSIVFPKELYDLPEGLAMLDAIAMLEVSKKDQARRRAAKAQTRAIINHLNRA
jgi:hypothetical protein